jgi:hypothetical protein
MKDNIRKFLQFNGRNIVFLSIDGQYWVALKPICEALGVNYDRQYKNLKSHKIFGQLYAIKHMVGADNRVREMVALPEMWVYGWLFSIQSDNQLLQLYQKNCCELLYNHFHGAITQRVKLLEEKSLLLTDMRDMKNRLANNPDFIKIEQIRADLVKNGMALKKADNIKIEQLLIQFNN